MTAYVVVEVGCIECGDETRVRAITSALPPDAQVLQVGQGVTLSYHECVIAIPVPPQAHNQSITPSPPRSPE